MKNLKSLLIAAGLVFTSQALADTSAGYFRVWEGFHRPDLSGQQFLGGLSHLMAETVRLYGGRQVLSNYLVAIPPQDKPAFIPDELALVALTSEADYRKIRETSEGKAYGDLHWDVFDRSTSHIAPQFIDYQQAPPARLVDSAAYDMIGKAIDWSTGYSLVYIGVKKSQSDDFLGRLQSHIELAQRHMVPQGLRGYIVTAHDDYEVAYLNWSSKEAHDQAMTTAQSQAVFADAGEIMDTLMYQEAVQVTAGVSVDRGKVYSTVVRRAL